MSYPLGQPSPQATALVSVPSQSQLSVKPNLNLTQNEYGSMGRKQSISSMKVDLLRNIPSVSAKCWAIFDAQKMSFIHGKREYLKRECASLTKIMTCYVVILLCRDWKMNPKTTEVTISSVASDIRGTSANLETGDILTVD
mmetsp:Transcript_36164/g.55533  ORF Transcript_36164/g.55533 Transcript_36164/m.55533 type:complete len:141 (+) Transcript_36164:3102-3524(+)